MRDMLDAIIFSQKAGNKEHGEGWQKVTETLNTIERFQVTGQGARDRILTLQRKQKGKLNKGRRAEVLQDLQEKNHPSLNY